MRTIVGLCVVGLMALPAWADSLGLPNEIPNPDFETGSLAPWTGNAEIHGQNDFGVPSNGASTKWAGAITSWGGTWDGAYRTMRYVIDESQYPGWDPSLNQKEIDLQFDWFAAARSGDSWRNVGINVYLDWMDDGSYPDPAEPGYHKELVWGVSREADPNKWAGDWPWTHETIRLVLPLQPRYLSIDVDFIVHFAEWSWVAIDNVDLEARCIPEPATLGLLALGLPLLRRRRS